MPADPLDPPQSLGSLAEYEALEKLAKAATPGPWAWEYELCLRSPNAPSFDRCILTCSQALTRDQQYIAAANPTTVLALLAEIKRLREAIGTKHPEFEDERVGYVSIQVDRSLWLECGGRSDGD